MTPRSEKKLRSLPPFGVPLRADARANFVTRQRGHTPRIFVADIRIVVPPGRITFELKKRCRNEGRTTRARPWRLVVPSDWR
jgi:hypothetical protein